DEIRFVGETNKKFEIQTVGTRKRSQFKIKADTGVVDITLGAPFDKVKVKNGAIDTTQPLKFKIEGESRGVLSLYNPTTVSFSGTARRETKFKFEQDKNKLEGRSDGLVSFNAIAGVSNLTRLNFFTTPDVSVINTTTGSGTTCTLCGSGNDLVVNQTVVIENNTTINIVDSGNGSATADSTQIETASTTASNTVFSVTSVENNTSAAILTGQTEITSTSSGTQSTIVAFNSYGYSVNTSVFTLSGHSFVAASQYQILVFSSDQPKIRIVNRGSDRYYVVTRGRGRGRGRGFSRSSRIGFKQIGPGCRIFPGLVGLREMSSEELEKVNSQMTERDDDDDSRMTGLEEIDDD
ncbi:MAG: hypothetical protein F6K10_40175, partial [Moorea sp. SIO2B7]|nr:hypothetical protein [Moorena sp. SIO2B7]